MMPFTAQELAEMAAADAEIEASFALTPEDLRRSRELDKFAQFQRKTPEQKKVAARQKAWHEANREKVAAQQKAWHEANREKVAAQQKAYREANREKWSAYQRACRAKKKREAETP